MNDAIRSLQEQCSQQRERCLYTSTSLFIWIRVLRSFRILFIVVPIICGTLAGWSVLKANPSYSWMTALLSLGAGLIPAVYAALKLDEHLPTAARLSGEYKNLEILFGDLHAVGPSKTFEEFEIEYKVVRSRLEAANATAYTTPEWCFKKAQKKIKEGAYTFSEQA